MTRSVFVPAGLVAILGAIFSPAVHATTWVGDSHCVGSARHWSRLRSACLRLDHDGIKLSRQGRAGLPAYVVFRDAENTGPAELFLPGKPLGSTLRTKADNGAGTWKGDRYTLTQWRGMYSLDDSRGRTIYQGLASP